MALTCGLLSDNPGVGGRVAKFQALFRGRSYRRKKKQQDAREEGRKICGRCDVDLTERAASELNNDLPDEKKVERWQCVCGTHVGENDFPVADTMLFACPTVAKCRYVFCKTCFDRPLEESS
jgi:hypothetical protein